MHYHLTVILTDCHSIRSHCLILLSNKNKLKQLIEWLMMLWKLLLDFKFSWLCCCTFLLSFATLDSYKEGPIDVCCCHYKYKCSFLWSLSRKKKFLSTSLHIVKRFQSDIISLIIRFLPKYTGILRTFGIYQLPGLLSIQFYILQVIMQVEEYQAKL